MAKKIDDGLIDMDRLARVFTWLAGTLMIFLLGMIFMNVIDADALNQAAATTTTTTSPVSN